MNQDLQKTLWAAADKLRSNMDAAEYKHVVLGLIFLKYISDAFDERREDLKAAFTDPDSELYIGDDNQVSTMLEDRDFYTMANVFWVPESARWEAIRNQAKQPDIGKGRPTIRAEEALEILEEKVGILRAMLHGFDYAPFRTKALALLAGACNHILGQDDGKKRFADQVLAASKAFALCCTLDAALEYRDELAFFQAIKSALSKHSIQDKKLSDEAKEHALRQIISGALVSDEVIDIFATAGLNKPNIGILTDEFLDDVKHMEHRNLAVELLERLLKDDIKSRFATNVVQSAKFSELLQASLTRYRNRAIETAQVIEELIAMAKSFNEAARRGENAVVLGR